MYETHVTVTGVVATPPRALILDDSLRITSFRLASTSRKRARDGSWSDGHTTWLTVTCWRGLAANVADSVQKRDRVVVHGRLRARDWRAADGSTRTSVEVDADAVGHDLSFGTATFVRTPRAEPVEPPGRADADALAQQVELDAAEIELRADEEDLDELVESVGGDAPGGAEGTGEGVGDAAGTASPELAAVP